jgi:Domain of unknown function (DUF4340)
MTKLPEFWKTYVALIAVGGLVAYIFLVEQKRDPSTGEKPKEKLFTLDKAKVKEITLARTGAETIRLVKSGADWRMAEPMAVAADEPAVESLLSSLEGLEVQDEAAANATKLEDYGLVTPRLQLTVAADGAKEPLRLLLGGKLVDGSGVYAKLPDKPRVFTIASFVDGALDKKPFDLRDRDFLKIKRDAVKTLAVVGPEGSYTLARDDKGEWAFKAPLATKAGRWAVDGLLGSVENLRMDSVAAEDAKDLKPFGLDKPARTLTLGLSDGSTRVLEIGAATADKKYQVRQSGSAMVAVVPPALVDELAKGMANLRAKRLLEVATYDVESFDATLAGAKKTYSKSTAKDKDGVETSKWKRTAPDAKELETSKVEDALFKVGGVEASELIDVPKADADYGLDAPAFQLAIRMGAGKGSSELSVGKKGAAAYARRSGDAAVLKLDAAKADELIKAFQEI